MQKISSVTAQQEAPPLLLNKFFLILFVLLLGSWPVAAQPSRMQTITMVETYLESLELVQADFLQAAPNGEISTGQFILSRPGKLRFDYAAPREDFIVADGRFIHFWDGDLKQQSSVPIGQTLADFILREDISLGDALAVTDLEEDEQTIRISLVQREQPGMGTLTLLLSKAPLTLQKWRVEDAQGRMTEVALSNLKRGPEVRLVSGKEFEFIAPNTGSLNN